MNPIWETTTKVRAFDVDANGRLKVNTILDYFQDVASNDADRLNFGYNEFVPKGILLPATTQPLILSNLNTSTVA